MPNLPMVVIYIKEGKVASVKADTPLWYAIVNSDNKDFHIFSVEGDESVSSILFGDVEFPNSS